MTRIDMTRFNPASMAQKLRLLGFTSSGAQQLAAAQVLSDADDRQRLRLVLTGLFESGAVRPAPQGHPGAIETRGGIHIELSDDNT